MEELLEAAESVLASWYEFHNEMPLHLRLDDLRYCLAELRGEVTVQRRRLAADDIVERVEQP